MLNIKKELRNKQLAFRTTEQIAQYLQAEADINEVTVSTLIEYIVKEFLTNKCPDLMKGTDQNEQ